MVRKSNEWWMFKAPNLLKTKMDMVRIERIKRGKDKQPKSYKRIGLALARHDGFWNDLINADFVEDKKGQVPSVFNIFTVIIVMFLAVVMFGGLIYVSGILNSTFHQIGIDNEHNAGQPGYVNMTQASDATFGQMNGSIQALRLVAVCLIFALIVGVFISNALIKIHPAFFFVYILIVILAVIFSAPLSNAYESLLQSNIYDGVLVSFTGANYMLVNLPVVTAIVGVLGGLFLFVNLIRTGGEGEFQ